MRWGSVVREISTARAKERVINCASVTHPVSLPHAQRKYGSKERRQSHQESTSIASCRHWGAASLARGVLTSAPLLPIPGALLVFNPHNWRYQPYRDCKRTKLHEIQTLFLEALSPCILPSPSSPPRPVLRSSSTHLNGCQRRKRAVSIHTSRHNVGIQETTQERGS